MAFSLSPKTRLIITISISFAFFVAEITVAFKTRSLALLADAFHYMNDLIGFIVALTAVIISERARSPRELSFGWQRARLLGAFFNGVFLLALGISIFLQSIERFISIERIEDPRLVMINTMATIILMATATTTEMRIVTVMSMGMTTAKQLW
ncbi:cation diffusion facilitator family metal ion [Diaporthe amygdali]|uniref:cation diffusion facilitator family metal ion n=1 Tax=Phomopsis amygdali TaxID=1214568 RepID=UPI0022FF3B2F|nr:cation diffusion facilitator family metal ion [Diaporthe amygdali]KAJ0118049.1 cation diffusion facilitator family metal ion [Diaporthe amygdali]